MSPTDPSPARIAVLTKHVQTLLNIHDAVARSADDASPFIEPEILSTLPITETQMPFFPEPNRLYFEPIFLRPLGEEHYQHLLDETFRRPNAHLRWSNSPDDYSNGKDVSLSAGDSRMAERFIDRIYRQIHMKTGNALPLLLRSDWCHSSIRFKHSGHGGIYSRNYRYSNRIKEPTWGTQFVYDASGIGVPCDDDDCSSLMPHISCMMVHPVPFENHILPSEIVCLTQMIANRMNYYNWASHRYIPVFCFTFNGPKARLTQAHFDGSQLRLLRTEAVDLIQPDGTPIETALNMLVRWLIGTPLSAGEWAEDFHECSDNQADQKFGTLVRGVGVP